MFTIDGQCGPQRLFGGGTVAEQPADDAEIVESTRSGQHVSRLLVHFQRPVDEALGLREPAGHPADRTEFVGDIRLPATVTTVAVDAKGLPEDIVGRLVVSRARQENAEVS